MSFPLVLDEGKHFNLDEFLIQDHKALLSETKEIPDFLTETLDILNIKVNQESSDQSPLTIQHPETFKNLDLLAIASSEIGGISDFDQIEENLTLKNVINENSTDSLESYLENNEVIDLSLKCHSNYSDKAAISSIAETSNNKTCYNENDEKDTLVDLSYKSMYLKKCEELTLLRKDFIPKGS